MLLAEYEVRGQFADSVSIEELARRFPGQANRLRELVNEVDKVEDEWKAAPKQQDTPAGAGATSSSHAERGFAPRELPERFGRYRIVRKLGGGGMGTVYLAHDPQLDRRVALKVPHFGPADGPEAMERFRREGRAAAQLVHPNVCQVYETGEVDGTHYLTMAYIEGRTLSEVLGNANRAGKLLPQHWCAGRGGQGGTRDAVGAPQGHHPP